ncbi:response regulator [Robertmurraya korlensis]|uniref:response regulator transcription factor n=1 Tax=Robertmurraya korlensis TaxID=519977 RepID=UPI00203D2D26|nr:response regulator [Robertmurraya korlensis]
MDDENRIRRGIERLVQNNEDEFQVIGSFSSALDVLNAYEKDAFAFDLLITDIKMPGMDGLDLIETLRKRASFEAVVISGFNDFKYLQTAIRAGAIDYLVKPIVREDFKEQLGKVKAKIKQKWLDEEKNEEIDAELLFLKQSQQLSELTKEREIDLSELEWTKTFTYGAYKLYYLALDQSLENRSIEEWKNRVEYTIHRVFKKKCRYWFWKGEESTYWVLTEGEQDVARELQIQLKHSVSSTHTLAVSDECQDVSLIASMKNDLQTLMQLRLLYGGNKVFTFSQLQQLTAVKGKEIKGLDSVISKMVHSLEREREEEAFDYLQQYLLELKSLSSPQDIEKYIQSLSVQLVNVLLKDSSNKGDVSLIQEAIQFTRKATSFSSLRDELSRWLTKIFQLRKNRIQQNEIDPIHIAKKWIQLNVGVNLTIEKIAREIPMNPTYFCEYFKSQTGETILDYVTKTRIEKAKELLLTTDLKIYDIAEKVGYADTKYFSKLFKKYYGEVPSKFKDKVKTESN